MHRVRANIPRERRLERLASPTPADNRISFGCINIPTAFYESLIKTSFGADKGIVYVLPETRPLHEVFKGLPAIARPGAAALPRAGAPKRTTPVA